MTPAIQIIGDQMSVNFTQFNMAAYDLFLKVKRLPEYKITVDHTTLNYTITAPARFAGLLGVQTPKRDITPLPISDYLFDDQVAIVNMALESKRFAVWADCGLGKTPIGLEWARHVNVATGRRVLIFTLGEIAPQWVEEAKKFYGDALPVAILPTREAMKAWCRGEGPDAGTMIAVTNYEKLNHSGAADQVVNELRLLGGVIADESSRLKTGGGKQKWALIKSTKGIEYKLSLTATPAPNEIMEFASQASFLEKMRDQNEIIWTFFRRDEKTKVWTVKKHARQAFFEFMAGWSIYIRNPRRYGWRMNLAPVPEPEIFEHELTATEAQRAFIGQYHADNDGNLALLATNSTNTIQRGKTSQVAKGFVYRKAKAKAKVKGKGKTAAPVEGGKFDRVESLKPGKVADLILDEYRLGNQVLVWTVFDAEAQIIAEELVRRGCEAPTGFDLLTGSVAKTRRPEILESFRTGKLPILISRPVLLGYGMNFQNCGAMVFSGFSDSYEQFYQALRRAYRHGQTKRLRVHIPYIKELEGESFENILRKQTQHEQAIAEMELNYIRALGRMRKDVA
jgi:superfamily II DNA or RNA helicase